MHFQVMLMLIKTAILMLLGNGKQKNEIRDERKSTRQQLTTLHGLGKRGKGQVAPSYITDSRRHAISKFTYLS